MLSSAAELEIAQQESLTLRRQLQSALSHGPADALQAELSGTQAALSELQQYVHTLETSPAGAAESRSPFASERKQLLGLVSVAKADEAQVRKRLQKLEHSVVAGGDGIVATVLLERDAELHRILAAQERMRNEAVLLRQTQWRMEVRPQCLIARYPVVQLMYSQLAIELGFGEATARPVFVQP